MNSDFLFLPHTPRLQNAHSKCVSVWVGGSGGGGTSCQPSSLFRYFGFHTNHPVYHPPNVQSMSMLCARKMLSTRIVCSKMSLSRRGHGPMNEERRLCKSSRNSISTRMRSASISRSRVPKRHFIFANRRSLGAMMTRVIESWVTQAVSQHELWSEPQIETGIVAQKRLKHPFTFLIRNCFGTMQNVGRACIIICATLRGGQWGGTPPVTLAWLDNTSNTSNKIGKWHARTHATQ